MTMENEERSAKVLIVDDDEEVRHALRLLFEFEDFSVVGEAANGVEAVALARNEQPDLVVLDYLMPRLNGEATAELLRALLPQVRIVAFSAVLQEQPTWADAFLNKHRIADVAPLLTTLISAPIAQASA